MEKLFTRNYAADYLGVSYSTMSRWAMLRVGPTFRKVGGQVRYQQSDLDRYLDEAAVEPLHQLGGPA